MEFLNEMTSHRESKEIQIKKIPNFDLLSSVAPRFTSISKNFHFQ